MTDGQGTVSLHRMVSKRIRNPAIRYEVERLPRVPRSQRDRLNPLAVLQYFRQAEEHPGRVHDIIDLGGSTLHQHRRTQQLQRDGLLEKERPEPTTVHAGHEAFEARHTCREVFTTEARDTAERITYIISHTIIYYDRGPR